MPFVYPVSKARKAILGPSTWGSLDNNLSYVRSQLEVEHIIGTGEHNALEVSRVCRLISGTTVSPSSSDITAVTNPSTGKYVLTLAASRFTADLRPQLNVKASDGKPYLIGYNAVSATSLEIYIQKLSSALGAGNAWAAANADFDIAIHSQPLTQGGWTALLTVANLGEVVDDAAAATGRWNAQCANQVDLYANVIAEHTSNGTHNTRQVAKYAGMVRYQGSTTYAADGSSDFATYTRVSAGIVQVTFADIGTTPVSAFVCPDWSRVGGGVSSDFLVMNAVGNSDTQVTVYIYKYDTSAKTWSVFDGDFFLAVHGI